jgi:hypothetical protein
MISICGGRHIHLLDLITLQCVQILEQHVVNLKVNFYQLYLNKGGEKLNELYPNKTMNFEYIV